MMMRYLYALPPMMLAIAWTMWQVRRRGLDRWLGGYLLHPRRRRAVRNGEAVHLLLCVADHFGPRGGGACDGGAAARGGRGVGEDPRVFGGVQGAEGGARLRRAF